MAATIGTKTRTVGAFLKKASQHIITGTGDYISSVMPTTTSTISGAGQAMRELARIPNSIGSITAKASELKNQSTFKKLENWFMNSENEFEFNDNFDAQLSFDTEDLDDSTSQLAETEISEWNRNANQISKSVVESSHKLFEAQISSTANLISSIDKQTAIISSGFDKTHTILEKILDTLTKNTATMIETMVASSGVQHKGVFDSDGKLNLSNYKQQLKNNFNNTTYGTYLSLASSIGSLAKGGTLTPAALISMGLGQLGDKFAPNLEKNMKALDESVRDVITDSLIRIGENKNAGGLKGFFSQLFGIDSSRTSQGTGRSQLELKNVGFDSMTRESIVGAIPGYLRQILTALGGPDLIYDFKSRSFRSQNSIRRQFNSEAISGRVGMLNNARSGVRGAIGNNEMGSMIYDLMMNDLGTKSSSGEARRIIASFEDQKATEDYILKTVLAGVKLTSSEREAAKAFANNLKKAASGSGRQAMLTQANRANIERGNVLSQVLQDADTYGMDLSFLGDTDGFDKQAILEAYGHRTKSKSSKIRPNDPRARLQGTNYTNMALYEIYRRLNEGINVFQVGKGKFRKTPFERFADDVLPKPFNHKPKQVRGSSLSSSSIGNGGIYHDDGSSNLLENQTMEDGTVENLSTGERLKRWGSQRGGNIAKAMFSGSPEQVKEAFGLVVRDVSQVAQEQMKKGLSRINDSFGNITGYLKHKLFGSAYSYDSGKTDKDGNPIMVNIKQNSAGGVFGFVSENIKSMFTGVKDRTFKWFKDVAGYFNYKGSGSSGVENKRRKFLISSIGAYAGAGLLGGPLGLLAGAIGANALDATGIGDKIKGMLFGKEEVDKDGNVRKKRGILTRVLDNVVDPFRYQIGKTFNYFTKTMKKQVLGPLSDLGLALKERITSTVANVAKSKFGKVFSFIGRMLMAPFKGALNLAKWPIQLLGGLTRGTMGAAGSAFGGTAGILSSIIAGSTKYDENGNIIGGRGLIAQRRKERNKQIDADYENDYKGGYSAWKAKQDDARSQAVVKLNEAMAEQVDTSKDIAESSKKTEEAVSNMNRLASEKGSLYTHDHGLHERIDAILTHFGISTSSTKWLRLPPRKNLKNDSIDKKSGLIDSLVGSTASIVSGDESVSADEARLSSAIVDEASKDNPNRGSVISKFKNLLGMQQKRKEEKGEKKKGLLETISDVVDKMGGLPTIIGGIGAALLLFSKDARQAIGSIISKLGTGFGNFLNWLLGNKDKNGNNEDGGITNLLTSPFDIRTSSSLGLIAPYAAGIYHVERDAAGNNIDNIAAANSRSALWREYSTQGTIRSALELGHRYDMNKHLNRAMEFDEQSARFKASGDTFESKLARRYSNKELDRAAYWEGRLREQGNMRVTERGTLAAQGGVAGILGGGAIGGFVGGTITRGALNAMGIQGPAADVAGNVGEAVGTVKGMATVTKMGARIAMGEDPSKYKIVNRFIAAMKDYLSKAADYIAASKPFKKIAEPVKKMLNTVMSKFTTKMLLPMATNISKALAKVGLNVGTGVATAGISTAAFAAIGGIAQAFQTENLFGVGPDKADKKMGLISFTLGMAFNMPYAPLLEIFDPLFSAATGGEVPSFRSWVAVNLYRAIASDEDVAELNENQNEMKEKVREYNEKYGTKLDTATYNDMVNPSTISKIWKGGILTDENGDVKFTEQGAVMRGGGLQGFLCDLVGKEVKKDENGKPIIGQDGTEEREDFDPIKFILQPVMIPFNFIKKIMKGIGDWFDNDSPWAKEGQTLPYWVGYKAGELPRKVDDFLVETKDSVIKWYDEDSPWGKEGKGPAEYAVSKISAIPGKLEDFLVETKDSVAKWFDSESPWQKEGKTVGKWILDKITYPFTVVKDKLDEFVKSLKDISLKDLLKNGVKSVGDYIADSRVGKAAQSLYQGFTDARNKKSGSGGGLDEISRGMGMSPLSQDAVITSDFGQREHPVFGGISNHRGIDIAPKNGSSADALATLPGRVTDVGFQKGGAGNYVYYQADNGLTMKYMHLADNGIPSGIKRGTRVNAGTKIGTMGSTGASTGPHLHYQMEYNGSPVDPTGFISGTSRLSDPRRAGSGINGDDILNEGTKWLGTPYVLGAADDATDATDCGKFTRDVCSKVGISVDSRLADVQYEMFEKGGAAIDVKDLQPGDFVFFENTYGDYPAGTVTHVGFYAGNGYALHAGSSKGVSFVPLDAMPYGQKGGSIQKLWNIEPGKGVDANMNVGEGTGGKYNGHGGAGGKIGGGSKASGPLGQLLESLKGAGSKFLNKVSGGLFGSEESSGGSSGGGGSSGSSASFSGLSGNDNAEKAFKFFTGKGLSNAAAAGIIGNLSAESGIDPSKEQYGGGPGRGIAQWEIGGRFDSLQEFAQSHGKEWNDLETQLEFLNSELETDDMDQRMSGAIAPSNFDATGYGPVPGGLSGFKKLDDYKHATAAFEAAFERAGIPHMDNRFAAAEEAYNTFGGGSGGPLIDPRSSTNIDGNPSIIGSTQFGKSVVSARSKRKGKGGGLDEIFSSIGRTVSSGARNMANSALDQFFGTTPEASNRYYVNLNPSNQVDDNGNPVQGSLGNTERVEALLSQVIDELRAINGNTSTSSALLDSLNQKDFVDHGLRDSINALGKASRNTPKPIPSRGNTRAIQNIIRP